MLPKEEREIIAKIGRYQYNKMKKMNLSYEEYLQYKKQAEKEQKIKKKIGYKKYMELKELGMTLEEYSKFIEETKYKNRQKYEEKNKIRFRTIRYIERYCNLDMKCQICGEKSEIHHPNYNDYLKINLLCKRHHTELHNFELVPPEIINLEKIAIKKPIQKLRRNYIEEQIENIKTDILKNKFTYSDLSKKYSVAMNTVKEYLKKQIEWEILESKLKENAKTKQILRHSHDNNPLLDYKQKYNLTSKEISEITKIPLPTIRAIESRKTNIENIKEITKNKLNILNNYNVIHKERR